MVAGATAVFAATPTTRAGTTNSSRWIDRPATIADDTGLRHGGQNAWKTVSQALDPVTQNDHHRILTLTAVGVL
jgi:hypothetical protein